MIGLSKRNLKIYQRLDNQQDRRRLIFNNYVLNYYRTPPDQIQVEFSVFRVSYASQNRPVHCQIRSNISGLSLYLDVLMPAI